MTKELTTYEAVTTLVTSALERGKANGSYEYAYALGMIEMRYALLLDYLKRQHPEAYAMEIESVLRATENNLDTLSESPYT